MRRLLHRTAQVYASITGYKSTLFDLTYGELQLWQLRLLHRLLQYAVTTLMGENILKLRWLLDKLGIDLADYVVSISVLEDLITGLEWRCLGWADEGFDGVRRLDFQGGNRPVCNLDIVRRRWNREASR